MSVAPVRAPSVLRPLARPASGTRLLVCVLLWYAASLVGLILNKHLLSAPAGRDAPRVEPMTLALVQTCATVLIGALSQARPGRGSHSQRQGKEPQGSGPPARVLLLLGSLRFLVKILGLVSLRHVAASFTETVKASSPFFTVAAAFALTGERTPLPQVLALAPVVGGLTAASAAELSFTAVGFAAALATNCVECVQNVLCKRLLQPSAPGAAGAPPRACCTPAQLQYYSAVASLAVQLPLFGGALLRGALTFPNETTVLYLLVLNGTMYYAQSVLAFEVMSQCSPVSVSVLNTAKRAMIICFSARFFGNSITPMAKIGTALTLAGGCLYSALRARSSGHAAAGHPAPAELEHGKAKKDGWLEQRCRPAGKECSTARALPSRRWRQNGGHWRQTRAGQRRANWLLASMALLVVAWCGPMTTGSEFAALGGKTTRRPPRGQAGPQQAVESHLPLLRLIPARRPQK